MDTTFRPSLLSDAAHARWLSPGLAAALHGAVAATVLVGLSLTPPQPDLEPAIVVELAPLAVPEPVAAPAVEPPQPPQPPARTLAKPPPQPAPRIVPKAAAPLKPAPANPTSAAPAPLSPSSPEPAAEAPAAAPSQPVAGTTAAGAAPAAEEAYVPPVGRAGYLSNPRPHYPSLARKRGWEGTVTLLVEVDADGSPVSVEVKTSSGHSVLDHCAAAAVRQWRFSPARRGGLAVAASVEVPIRFDLTEESQAG